MPRSLPALLAVFALAVTILVGGCGGGGGGGTSGGTDGGTTGNTDPGVVRNGSGVVLTGAKVTYYTASGTKIRTDTLTANGRLRSIPSNAARFAVDGSSISDGAGGAAYYNTFLYNGLFYDISVGCYAPLPVGAFPTDVVFFARSGDTIPPPPNGCVG